MSAKAREKARNEGQRSGKGGQYASRFMAWLKQRGDDENGTSDYNDSG